MQDHRHQQLKNLVEFSALELASVRQKIFDFVLSSREHASLLSTKKKKVQFRIINH